MSHNALLLDPDLAGHWGMQETSGTAVADFVSGNDGTFYNGTISAGSGPGRGYDSAIIFNGIDQDIALDSTIGMNAEMALVIWAKRDLTNRVDIMLGGHAGAAPTIYYRFENSSTQLRLRVGAQNPITHEVTSTAWNHYGITRRVDGMYDVFVNGVNKAEDVITPTAGFNFRYIGTATNTADVFDGMMAGCIGWNRDLTPTEFSEAYEGPELNYVSGASLTVTATSVSGNVGTWTLPSPYTGSNGTPTYAVKILNSSNTVVATPTVTAGAFSAGSLTLGPDTYRLFVAATNNGGVDVGDGGDGGAGYYLVSTVVLGSYNSITAAATIYDPLDTGTIGTVISSGSGGATLAPGSGRFGMGRMRLDGDVGPGAISYGSLTLDNSYGFFAVLYFLTASSNRVFTHNNTTVNHRMTGDGSWNLSDNGGFAIVTAESPVIGTPEAWCITRQGTTSAKLYRGTSEVANDTILVSLSSTTGTLAVGCTADLSATPYYGYISEFVFRNGSHFTAGEVAELVGGPELQYVSGATLTVSATSVSGSLGTWAMPNGTSNGTPTYDVKVLNSSNTVVATATAISGPTYSIGSLALAIDTYRLFVRANNTGGYDTGDGGDGGPGYYEVDDFVLAGGDPEGITVTGLTSSHTGQSQLIGVPGIIVANVSNSHTGQSQLLGVPGVIVANVSNSHTGQSQLLGVPGIIVSNASNTSTGQTVALGSAGIVAFNASSTHTGQVQALGYPSLIVVSNDTDNHTGQTVDLGDPTGATTLTVSSSSDTHTGQVQLLGVPGTIVTGTIGTSSGQSVALSVPGIIVTESTDSSTGQTTALGDPAGGGGLVVFDSSDTSTGQNVTIGVPGLVVEHNVDFSTGESVTLGTPTGGGGLTVTEAYDVSTGQGVIFGVPLLQVGTSYDTTTGQIVLVNTNALPVETENLFDIDARINVIPIPARINVFTL